MIRSLDDIELDFFISVILDLILEYILLKETLDVFVLLITGFFTSLKKKIIDDYYQNNKYDYTKNSIFLLFQCD
jgi:hypothetical protein